MAVRIINVCDICGKEEEPKLIAPSLVFDEYPLVRNADYQCGICTPLEIQRRIRLRGSTYWLFAEEMPPHLDTRTAAKEIIQRARCHLVWNHSRVLTVRRGFRPLSGAFIQWYSPDDEKAYRILCGLEAAL